MEITLNGAARDDIFDGFYSQLGLPPGGRSLDAAWDVLSSLPEKCAVHLTRDCGAAESPRWRDQLCRLLRDAERDGYIELTIE